MVWLCWAFPHQPKCDFNMMNLKNQKGGTFLGFIIGLITGLVIAVIVALLITRTPIPFSGRQDKPESAPVPAASVTPATDPNQALYGNKDAKPATATAPDPTGTNVTGTTTPTTNNVSPTVPSDQEKDPIAAAIRQKETAKQEDKAVYWLQAGAFRNRTDAENMRGNLALLGFESSISEATSNNGKVYRVRLGPYKSNNVNSAHSKLAQNGIKTTITRAK